MAQGYLGRALAEVAGTSASGLLYCKTNIGGYFFDGFINVSHDSELVITENQVETGVSVVDHAYMKPATLSMRIMVSDVHRSLVSGQFGDGWARHTSAWNVLKKMQSDRIPVSVFTKLGLYDNMLIQSLTAVDNPETIRSLVADVTLREVPIATLKTVKISEADQTTQDAELGKVNVQYLTDDQWSTLYEIFNN